MKLNHYEVKQNGKKMHIRVERAYHSPGRHGSRSQYLTDDEVAYLKSKAFTTMCTSDFDGNRHMSEQLSIEIDSQEDALSIFNSMFENQRKSIPNTHHDCELFGQKYSDLKSKNPNFVF